MPACGSATRRPTSSGCPPGLRRWSERSTGAMTRWPAVFAAIWQTWDLFQFEEAKSVTSAIRFSGSVAVKMRGSASQIPARPGVRRSHSAARRSGRHRSRLSSRGERPSKPWGCRSKTLTPTPEPAGYCAGDVAGERGDRASLLRGVRTPGTWMPFSSCATPRSRWTGRGPVDSRQASTADARQSEAFGAPSLRRSTGVTV